MKFKYLYSRDDSLSDPMNPITVCPGCVLLPTETCVEDFRHFYSAKLPVRFSLGIDPGYSFRFLLPGEFI